MRSKEYKYIIGEIIKTKSGKIQILKQIRMGKNTTYKGYIYKCLVCGNTDEIYEDYLKKNVGCNTCAGKKVKMGFNDLWTTNAQIAELLLNPNDGYFYSKSSEKKVNWKCPDCNNIIENKSICTVTQYRLVCPNCSDGISYPNKIAFSLLKQLKVCFQSEYSPDWIKPKRYDFYFELNNDGYIIEMDGGLGHDNKNPLNGKTSEENIEIDNYKDHLAQEHNIEVIRIDSKKSELDYIKNNIINSKLHTLFDLNNIDWLQCEKFALSSLIKTACTLWKEGLRNPTLIGIKMNLCSTTIENYLKKGRNMGLCDYKTQYEIKELKIELINKEWNSGLRTVRDIVQKTGIEEQTVRKYLKILTQKKLCNYSPEIGGVNKRKIICLTTGKIFNSIVNAKREYGIKSSSNIVSVCKGQLNFSGKHPITGEPLRWMYYDEWLEKQRTEVPADTIQDPIKRGIDKVC